MRIPALPEKIVRVRRQFWFSGWTFYPFIILTGGAGDTVLEHERVHYRQVDRWWAVAGPFGWLAWYFLWLFVLPVGWNPFRWRWEYEAYRTHTTDEAARKVLRGYYMLWWMR